MSLVLEKVNVRYGSNHILIDLDLQVSAGRILGLLGSNGAGKSTIQKSILRIVAASSGKFTWSGKDIHSLTRKELAKIVAYVPQSTQTPFALTVENAVLLGRTPHFGIRPGKDDWTAVDEALRRLDLGQLANKSVSELSGGQLQRVLIARAIAQNSPVLLLDEPTSALDLKYQIETLRLLRSIVRERDASIVIAIHDLNHASRFTDEVAFLSKGRIIAHGAPADVYSPELISEVYGIDAEITYYHGSPEVRPIYDASDKRNAPVNTSGSTRILVGE